MSPVECRFMKTNANSTASLTHAADFAERVGGIAFIAPEGPLGLDSLFTDFVGPNTNGFVDIVDEYFAVSDFAGLR